MKALKSITFFLCAFICLSVVSIVVADELRILTCEEPPTNYYLIEGEFSGTSMDIVEEIKRSLNLDVEIEVLPWVRAYSYAKKDANIVVFTCGRSQERIDHGFHFIGPVITRKHVFWSKKGKSFNISSIKDVKEKNLELGAMRGCWRSKFLMDQGLKVQNETDHKQNIRKLLTGRIDLWVSSDIEAPPIAKEAGVDIEEIEIAFVFKEAASYIMLSRDTPQEMIEQWEKAYSEIQKTDFFIKASKKWSDILGYEMGYANDKGFFVK